MSNSITLIFRKLTAALTLLFSGFIFYKTITEMYSCHLSVSTGHLTWILLAAAFVLASVLFLFWNRVQNSSPATIRKIILLFFAAMVFLQLLLTFISFRHYLPWADSLSVFQEAISMSASEHPSVSSAGRYFEMYGNNYFFTILLCYYFKFFRLFGCTAYWMEGLFLNILAMDAGVAFCIYTVYRLYSPKKAVLISSLCLCNPFLYLFIPFVYTNTISIPFTMGIFCLALLGFRETSPRKRILYSIAQAFLIGVGFQIRVTVIIPVIALILCWLIKRILSSVKLDFKAALRPAAIFLLSFLLIFGGCKLLIRTHVPEDIQSKNFPVTHWVMMGLQGNGGYLASDEDFTYQIPEKNDKIQANLNEIVSRIHTLSDQGVSGILNFITRKLTNTWASQMDGLYLETGRMQQYHPLQKYLSGFKNDLVVYYCQFYKILIYLLCIACLIQELMSRDMTDAYPYILTWFGFFLFYLIWESNCRYAICLTLLLNMIAFHGADSILERSPFRFRKAAAGCMFLFVLIPCIYAAYKQYPAYTKENISKTDYSVLTIGRDYHENEVTDLIRDNKVLTQTFTTAHPFNEIGIYVTYNGQEEWSEEWKTEQQYRFRLLGSDGTVLSDQIWGPEGSGKYYKLFGFDLVIPSKTETYAIEISAADSSMPDRIHFIYFDFDAYDYVLDAELSVDGKPLSRDLVFMVSWHYNGSYTTPSHYFTLCTALILFLAGLSVLLTGKKFTSSIKPAKLVQ